MASRPSTPSLTSNRSPPASMRCSTMRSDSRDLGAAAHVRSREFTWEASADAHLAIWHGRSPSRMRLGTGRDAAAGRAQRCGQVRDGTAGRGLTELAENDSADVPDSTTLDLLQRSWHGAHRCPAPCWRPDSPAARARSRAPPRVETNAVLPPVEVLTGRVYVFDGDYFRADRRAAVDGRAWSTVHDLAFLRHADTTRPEVARIGDSSRGPSRVASVSS